MPRPFNVTFCRLLPPCSMSDLLFPFPSCHKSISLIVYFLRTKRAPTDHQTRKSYLLPLPVIFPSLRTFIDSLPFSYLSGINSLSQPLLLTLFSFSAITVYSVRITGRHLTLTYSPYIIVTLSSQPMHPLLPALTLPPLF